jgi:methylthioribose-1-phosphate isomerase
MKSAFKAISWTDSGLRLLDQRRLPHAEIYLDFVDAIAVAEAIRDMVVRGAPAIGITAAYAVVLAAQQHTTSSPGNWRTPLLRDIEWLAAARPTLWFVLWLGSPGYDRW